MAKRAARPGVLSEGSFGAFVLDQLHDLGNIEARPMFGGAGFYHEGSFFGILYKQHLYFRVTAGSIGEYTKRKMKPFAPFKGRRGTSRNYYQVPIEIIESPRDLVAWARRAAESRSQPTAMTETKTKTKTEPKPAANGMNKNNERVFKMAFASVYPHYVQKAEKKGRTKKELDEVISWLTGYSSKDLTKRINERTDFRTFFSEAPALNPNVSKITGTVCGVRIEEIDDPLMRKIRYLDNLLDELSKGRPMEKILRQ